MDNKKALKEIQKILASLGYYLGVIDGDFGWNSYNAVLRLSKPINSADLAKRRTFIAKNAAKEIQKILVEQRLYFGAIDGDFGGGSMSALNHLIPMPKVTEATLKKIYSGCASGFAHLINEYASQFKVMTKADLCAFIANTLHESEGYKKLRENVNYSAKRLVQVFPTRFKTLAYAQSIASRGVIAICDVIYGGRFGNSINNGDGYKYRGGGLIHLTFFDNYRLCSIGINEPQLLTNPEIIEKPEIALKSAFWFWSRNACSRPANQGNFDACCIIVNGGKNGLAERKALHIKSWNSLF